MSHHSFPHEPSYAQYITAKQSEHYSNIDQELETLSKEWNTLGRNLEQQAKSSGTQTATQAQDSQESLLQWVQSFRETHGKTLQKLQSTVKTQKRTRDRFTMAFMGRTKAGKSTLLAFLLNQGDEGIGNGQQRTTRENRIYDLPNHVRLIDTPGIAAVGGEADTEEALKAVDQADVICYVMSSDSIQIEELNVFRQLKDQSKPLVILINMQKDLTRQVHRRRFLEKPEKVMASSAIEEHKTRIYEHLEEYYGSSPITVFPVMLLAARLSQQEADPSIKETLYTASQISAFLDYGDDCIRSYLPLIASKNLVGGSCDALIQFQNSLRDDQNECEQFVQTLAEQFRAMGKQLSDLQKDIEKEINVGVDQIYSAVIQEIPFFVRTVWSKSTKDQQVEWEKLKKDKKLEWQTTELTKRLNRRYIERTRDFVEETGFQYETPIKDSCFSGKNAGFDFSGLLTATSIALSVGSFFIPGGIFVKLGVMGVGAVSGVMSERSKKNRQQKSITELEDLLRREMQKEREDLKQHIKAYLETQVGFIKNQMNARETSVQNIPIKIEEFLNSALKNSINKMTGRFAKDILMYCYPSYASMRTQGFGQVIARVQRKPNHWFHIFTRLHITAPQKEREAQCSKIIGELITFTHLSNQ